MGICLEQYRQRIGTFQPKVIKPKFLLRTSPKYSQPYPFRASESIKRRPSLRELLSCATLYLLFFMIFSGSYHIDQNTPSCVYSMAGKMKGETFFEPCNSKFFWMKKKSINKLCHAINGNRRNPGYKYFSWNCDRGFLSGKKIEDLKCYSQRTKPHIMSVIEVNLVRNENNVNDDNINGLSTTQVKDRFQIPEYTLVLPESWYLYNKARIILYVHQELNFKVCKLDDDEKHLQSITLEVGFGRSSKHHVNFYYREWTSCISGQSDQHTQSENLKKLMNIWQRYTDTTKDFVSMGDMNLCALKWNDPKG